MIFSVDYDVKERKIFWIDLNAESIKWITLGTKSKGTLVKGVKSDCIAVDWVGRNLYWTDGTAGHILATRLSTNWKGFKEYAIVVDKDLEQPHSLVLQPLTGLMYWSEIGIQPQIEQAGMDGSQRKILVTKQLGWPTGLSLDLLSSKIYWADDKFHCIGSANLDGTDVKVIQLKKIQSPFSLAVFEDEIYWSEIKARTVQKINKRTGKDWATLIKRHVQPYGLKVMHEFLQPQVENPCQHVKCSHLCLIGPSLKGSCWCPADLILSTDMLNCIPLRDLPFLLIAFPTSVKQIYFAKLTAGNKVLPKMDIIDFSNINRFSSIDYIVQQRTLVFAVGSGGFLGSAKIKDVESGDWKRVLSVDDSVLSIAVDWITGNLYWISTNKPYVQVATSNGMYKAVLINDGLAHPFCVAVSPTTSIMCYSDIWSESQNSAPRIECSFMDGNRKRVLWKKTKMATGLTFADSGTLLYWADRSFGTIESIKLDGSKHKVIQSGLQGINIFTVADGTLLWTTVTNGSTKVWYKKAGAQQPESLKTDQRVVDLKVYSKYTQQGNNRCSEKNGGCSQICLPNPEGRTCKCSAGHRLVNGTLCLEDYRCPKAFQPCKDGLKCISLDKVCNGQLDCLDGSDEKNCDHPDKGFKTNFVTHPEATKKKTKILNDIPIRYYDSDRSTTTSKTGSLDSRTFTASEYEQEYPDLTREDFETNMDSNLCNGGNCNKRGKFDSDSSGKLYELEESPLAVPLTLGTIAVLLAIAAAAVVFVFVTRRRALQRTSSSASSKTLTRKVAKEEEPEPENLVSETFLNDAFECEGLGTDQDCP
ncbi:hypothetical protein GDO86_000850 [Hymenochirus boettgeri]|uniref:EGF-like domain-containing protein n=1 Tax=Hymenochirus boettgeri TaxID=247094 RepID=A0A8T2KFN5_9PIPI|nr:hypothetical protein GDO86_000850 [Hymenochirus boettgeri]